MPFLLPPRSMSSPSKQDGGVCREAENKKDPPGGGGRVFVNRGRGDYGGSAAGNRDQLLMTVTRAPTGTRE